MNPLHRYYEHLLNELLAIIHRDGGHYVQEHGIEKAVEGAIKIINKERAVITYLRQRAGGGMNNGLPR